MRKSRRTVITPSRAPRGGHPKLWGYGYPELALLFDMSEGAVRQAVYAKRFDPGSLASITAFRDARQAKKGSR